MKKLLLVALFYLLKEQLPAHAEEHICDFTKEKYLLGKNEKEYCVVEAKPFDSVTFICPKKIGAQCFQNVNTEDDISKEKMESSKLAIDELLYGSTLYGDTLLISPTVKQSKTFYCFCNLEMKDMKKYLQKKRLSKEKEKEKENAKKKSTVNVDNLENADEDMEVIVPQKQEDQNLVRALHRVRKIMNIIEREKNKEEEGDDSEKKKEEDKEEEEEEEEEEELVVEEKEEEKDKNKIEKIITKYGVMKVVVSTNHTITKGCDFGNNVVNYFSKPYPIERYGGSKVCRIEAKPGEFVGFKCIYDNTGSVEPHNCFDKVFYEGKETDLQTLMPGYISYGNKKKGKYAFYLKLPHFVQHSYTIRCKCRSTVWQYDDYVFELAVEGGESDVVAKSFHE
ncbi:6-cysteine protein [Plasmodium knowlesi strain H]|uniref:6-cysteine protein n=3 Tax=Plasmodium knowlesi TaxID=5850 RepID=A0A5K1UMZ8_PLAKH|nr:6-cysteine protein P41 [Plasmodium knowlesi strain H]OTN68424.1 6-cysteine protein [Plasmodium knowlesi]CAA9986458.1 6-cysteine protein P41 [Plasmodium knowlesi strain H]SBO24291.1 6-cysteine protein [Plasmodium knowlesi strain H]SBO29706.1 6-cysteine protein [Plasmodium knowlesi strain H]VVS75932.1 6-cysteine protein P41 [Plasmodium knowlesi strain H]|eukprot:XP_002261009.1 transmission-blocking target antigen Pfs230,putative [Plasmodium knowlesi strain H]